MLMSFIGWVLQTLQTAAEAEMNDDTALREQLLEAEMRRELGEISDGEFRKIEADLLARIRETRKRREEDAGSLTTGAVPIETSAGSRLQIEASVAGDFHEPARAPHTTVVETEPGFEERISVLDMRPGDARPPSVPGLPLSRRGATVTRRRAAAAKATRTSRTTRPTRTARTNSSKLRSS